MPMTSGIPAPMPRLSCRLHSSENPQDREANLHYMLGRIVLGGEGEHVALLDLDGVRADGHFANGLLRPSVPSPTISG